MIEHVNWVTHKDSGVEKDQIWHERDRGTWGVVGEATKKANLNGLNKWIYGDLGYERVRAIKALRNFITEQGGTR
jgi:hypothetical protein